MLLNQHGFQALSLDANSNIYNNIHRPEPITNIISPQLCIDLGMDSLSTFAQSNQACNNLLNQLILTKTELPQRQEELLSINKRFEVGVAQNTIRTGMDMRQLQESSINLHNYVLELDSKILRTKTSLISQLETSCQLMNQAMHSLVADKLVSWLVKQKVVSCGARATIKAHYDALDTIDSQFEECGRQIIALVNLLANVEQSIGQITTDDIAICSKIHKIRSDLIQNSRQFIWQSIIVSVQPPAVLVKCRVSDSHRSTRFPCKTELRILGGQALGVRESNKTGVQVELISEEMARQIQQDPCKSAVKDQSFNLIYNESHFQLDSTTTSYNLPVYRAVFDRIRLVENVTSQKRSAIEAGLDEKKGTRRSKVSSLRYYFAFKIQTGPFLQSCRSYSQSDNGYIDVSGYKLSLPVAALVHSSLEADASLFWNRAFSEGTGILSFVPDTVDWEKAKVALDLKWRGIIQEPQDVKDLLIDLPEPRALAAENFAHLAYRLDVSNGVLHKKNFFHKAIAHKENRDGNPLPSVFYEWFYKCGSIVNKYMIEQWNDGCIMGFCSKECSERILCATLQPTMLIRFSDLVLGYLKISCKLADNRVVHYETEAEKMPLGTSISDAIRSNPTFAFIQNIYPNRRVSSLWQDREKVEESRAANWSGIPSGYFDKVYSLESKPVAAIDT